jgi:hypothetical protein
MRRRDVIKMAAAIGALAPLQAADAAPARVLVVYDPRRPVSVAYARRWSAFGAAVRPTSDDVFRLWRRARRSVRPLMLTGVTSHAHIMVLKAEARAAGRTVSAEPLGGGLFAWTIA